MMLEFFLVSSAMDLVGHLRVNEQACVIKKHPFSLRCDHRLSLSPLPCTSPHGPYVTLLLLLLLLVGGQSWAHGLART